MEIISYFDSKSVFSLPNDTLTLEDMLHRQQSKRKHSTSFKTRNHKKEVLEKKEQFVLELFCSLIMKARYVFLGICAAVGITFISLYFVLHFQAFAQPVDFHEGILMEEEILTSAMQNFVSNAKSSQSYEQIEALSLISTEEIDSLYSQAVTFTTYTVNSGDSIHTISDKFGLDNISTLIGINEIDNVRLLRSGQELIVPSVDGLMYSVVRGDSLESISKDYSITIEEILDVNELESSVIQIGDKLFIPGARLDTNSLRQAMGELFKHPLSGGWRLSSNYGYRADPFTGVRSFHTGADFAIAKGTPVRASMSGTVSVAGYSSIYGYYVIVNHGNGYQTLYAHFMEAAPVSKGQSVSQNTVVGYVGSTGYSTGNHLHFSVYKEGQLVSPKTVIQY